MDGGTRLFIIKMLELLIRWLKENQLSTLPLALSCRQFSSLVENPLLLTSDLSLNNLYFFRDLGFTNFCGEAGKRGDIEFAKEGWKIFKTCCPDNEICCINFLSEAIYAGHLSMIEWAIQQNPLLINDENIMMNACCFPKIEVLKLLLSLKISWRNDSFELALVRGDRKVLHWMIQNGCALNHRRILETLIVSNRADILQWMTEMQFIPIDLIYRQLCCDCAHYGNLRMLITARENNYFWSTLTVVYAAMKGHFHILEWGFQNGVPWIPVPRRCYEQLWPQKSIDWMVERGHLL